MLELYPHAEVPSPVVDAVLEVDVSLWQIPHVEEVLDCCETVAGTCVVRVISDVQ
ncbi:MAG: hypothetical protein ACRDH7_03720 [Actinomycetota bacterium]